MRILVADDDARNRLILQDMLLGTGHEVVDQKVCGMTLKVPAR